MGLTKHQFEMQKESIEQRIRQLDISILKERETQKQHQLTAAKIDTQTALEGIKTAEINLKKAQISNQIGELEVTGLNNKLSATRALIQIEGEQLAIQVQQAKLALDQSKIELQQATELFSLKYGSSVQSPMRFFNGR